MRKFSGRKVGEHGYTEVCILELLYSTLHEFNYKHVPFLTNHNNYNNYDNIYIFGELSGTVSASIIKAIIVIKGID